MDFTLLDDISLELATVLEETSAVFRKRLKKQMKKKQGPLSYMHFFQKEYSSATYLTPLLYNQENERSTSEVNMQHVGNIGTLDILLSNQLSKKTVEMEYVDKIGGLCSIFELKKGAVDKKALKITEDLTPNILNIHVSVKDAVSKIKSEQYFEEDATDNKIIDKTEKEVKTVSDIVLKIIQNGEEWRKNNSVSSSVILGSAIGSDDIVKKLGDAEDTVSEDKILPIVLEKAVSHAETQDQKSLNDYIYNILGAITPFANEQDHDVVPVKLEQLECFQEITENISAYKGAADLPGFIIDGLLEKATALTAETVKSDSIESIQEDTDYGWIIPEVNSDSVQSLPEDPEYGWIVTPEIYPQYLKGLESPVPSSNNIYDRALFLVNEAVHQAHLIIQGRDKSEEILDQCLKIAVPDIDLETCLNSSNLDLQNLQEDKSEEILDQCLKTAVPDIDLETCLNSSNLDLQNLQDDKSEEILDQCLKTAVPYIDLETCLNSSNLDLRNLQDKSEEILDQCLKTTVPDIDLETCLNSSNLDLQNLQEELLGEQNKLIISPKHYPSYFDNEFWKKEMEEKSLDERFQEIQNSCCYGSRSNINLQAIELEQYLSNNQEEDKNEIDGATEERKSKIRAFIKRVQQAGRRVLRIFRYSAKDKKINMTI